MKKRIFILWLCALCITQVFAQKQYSTTSSKRLTFKIDATKLIEPDMNISVAVENKFHKIFSGYDLFFSGYEDIRVKGFRIVPEFRNYYFGKDDDETPTWYMGGQVLYKYVSTQYDTWQTKQDGAGQTYQAFTTLYKKKSIIAPHIMLGKIIFLGQESRWAFDVNIGVGARDKRGVQSPELNAGGFTGQTNLNYSTISMAANFKLCYSLFRE
jgi:hypothetical protein